MAENIVVLALREYVANHECSECRWYGNAIVKVGTHVGCNCNTNVVEARRLIKYDEKIESKPFRKRLEDYYEKE